MLMADAGELPDWVQKMMGNESLKMILERYNSCIKNYQRDDDSAFMDNVYNPSVKQDDEMPDEDEKTESFTLNLHQNEKREFRMLGWVESPSTSRIAQMGLFNPKLNNHRL